MLKRYAESFYQAGVILANLQSSFDENAGKFARETMQADPTGEKRDKVARLVAEPSLSVLGERLRDLDLQFTLRALDRMSEALEGAKIAGHDVVLPPLTTADLIERYKDLDRRIRDELQERVLFFVAPDRAAHYDDFRRGWEDALAKFPIAVDVEEAEKCFALERWTGCVFHLMRIVEIGVQELGNHLKIRVAATEAWGTVVREVQDAVKAMPHSKPAEKEAQSRFGNLADALFQINLAWRIPTMHPRTPGASYNEEQASEALGRVKSFMRGLADTLP